MEIDLDPETADSLAEEATERGFESPDAYARWLLEHREAILRPPGEQLGARLERVEGQLERLQRTLEDGFATEVTVESGTTPSDGPDAGEWFDEDRASGGESAGDRGTEDSGVSEFAYSDDLEPPADEAPAETNVDEEPEEAADDDEIAEALADVELEDDEEAADEDA